jgi:hypothetical protein
MPRDHDGIDFDELIRRAERQAAALERRRLAVAADALSYAPYLSARENGNMSEEATAAADRYVKEARGVVVSR